MCLHLLQKLQEYLHCFIMVSGLSSHDSAIAISKKQWYLSISSSQGSDLMSVESSVSIITQDRLRTTEEHNTKTYKEIRWMWQVD